MMFFPVLFLVLFVLFTHRLFCLSFPFFAQALESHFWLNIGCGLLSDMSIGVILALVMYSLGKMLFRFTLFSRRILTFFSFFIAVIYIAALALHLRYIEHFAMTVRPFHLSDLLIGDVLKTGPGMMLTPKLIAFFLLNALGMIYIAFKVQKIKKKKIVKRVSVTQRRWIITALAVGLVSHASVIQLRGKVGLHSELKYNPFAALYFQYKEYKTQMYLAQSLVSDPAALKKVQDFLPGQRSFEPEFVEKGYPLWQSQVAVKAHDKKESKVGNVNKSNKVNKVNRLEVELKDFLEKEKREKGPWNVMIVLSESLRAEEVGFLSGKNSEDKTIETTKSLTPGLDKISRRGISFTEVLSAGIQTQYGQLAANCSLYSFEGPSLILAAPMGKAVCLSDVFHEKNYRNYFFYPADNNFDNQYIFYQNHHMHEIHGEEMFDPNSKKGGWGYSDHALFEHVLKTLRMQNERNDPFFSVVLTLTNHPPFKIPDDVPPGVVDTSAAMRPNKLYQYVDWAFSDFYEKFEKDLSHTIVFYVADHGMFYDENASMESPYPLLRQIARIPLLLLIPGLPDHLKGLSMKQLASITDIPPTVLSLMGWENTKQQFMGMNLFEREGPVYVTWQTGVKEVQSFDDRIVMRDLDMNERLTLTSLVRFNQLIP